MNLAEKIDAILEEGWDEGVVSEDVVAKAKEVDAKRLSSLVVMAVALAAIKAELWPSDITAEISDHGWPRELVKEKAKKPGYVRSLSQASEPEDRVSRLSENMLEFAKVDEEYVEGDQLIVCIGNPDSHRGAIGYYGYEEDIEAGMALVGHLRAVFQAAGAEISVIPMPGGDS